MHSGEVGALQTAFVTFKDPKALEIALLLSVSFIYCVNFVVNYGI